ncbi:carboxypeptidase regulatory-like domain-containing protein [Archangium violaceum]|uniref:carboxypeptidase regulatory-like domain-containing protein n=1 Tax=Archangium violaceum TaxID=83451 RepID=UPI002B2B39EA|nr:carboxypeptidase regulatory-like domain-containing protein [Archangium gephyra]
MRRGWIIGVGAGLLALLLWLVWRPEAAPESNSRATATSRRPQVERTQAAPSLWSSATPAEPRGTLSIEGQVVGPWGPVPGAIVVAFESAPREWSTLTTPGKRRWGGWFLSTCELSGDALPLLELAAELRGQQAPLARAITDAQGNFRLEGLEGGAVALWAESGEGIGLRAGVAAGSTDVEVPLGPGKTFSGEVYDEQGRPVAGALVTTLQRDAGRLVEASTNEEGRFLLGPLPWGDYDVLVSKEGLVPVRLKPGTASGRVTLSAPRWISGQVVDARGAVPGATVQAEGVTPPGGSAVTDVKGQFRLEGLCPGWHVLTASLGERYARHEVFLETQGDRESVVLFLGTRLRLSGHVLDTSGQPIPNAEVLVFSEAPQWSDGVRTDARGGFLFERLVPGTYTLRVMSSGYEPQGMPPRPLAASQELPPFTLKEWEVVRPPRAADGDSTLEVEWVDAAGRPVSQAPVHLSKRGDTVTTGMDGRAVFQGLSPGHYMVTPQARERWIRYVPVAVELRSAETRKIRLQPEEGWILSGQLVDDGGKPIEGATLEASRVARRGAPPEDPSSERLWRSVQGTTGPEGRFTLAQLPEGPCTLRVSGYVLDASASSGLDESVASRGEVVVLPGGPDVRLVVQARRRVVGRVVREDGKPIPSFQINRKVVSHPEGRFSLPVVSSPWDFEAPGFSPVSRSVPLQGDEELDLGDVVLVADRTVRGRVLEAGTSAPIAGAWVEVASPERSSSARVEPATYTLPDGSFTVEGVKAGRKTVRVSHPDWLPARVVLAEAQREVTVELEPGATLEGRVESAGAPVRSGVVRLRSEQGEVLTTLGFGEGRYSVRAIPAGRYLVQVEGQSEQGVVPRFPVRQVTLSRGDTVTLDFTERSEGASLEVHVPERNLEVHLIPGNLPIMGPRDGLFSKLGSGLMGKTVREGVQRFPRLPAGNYTLFAMRRGEDSTEVHREELELPAEGDVSFTLLPVWTHYDD